MQEAQLLRKCPEGTLVLLIQALNHGHPDVYVTYDDELVDVEFDEILENKFFDATPRLFNALSTKVQRNTVKEFRQDRKMPPAFVANLGDKIKAEMTAEYGSSQKKKLISTCSPEQINQRKLNLPTAFSRLVAIMDSMEELISRGHNYLPSEVTALLQKMVNDACSNSFWPRSLEQECALLEEMHESCMYKHMGISLKALSIFNDNTRENAGQSEKQSSVWSSLPGWK